MRAGVEEALLSELMQHRLRLVDLPPVARDPQDAIGPATGTGNESHAGLGIGIVRI